MKIVGSGLIFLMGFVLGAALFHTRATQAQAVKHVTVIPLVEGTPTSVIGDVIGFSCVARSPRSMPPAACYIATQ
jgi:hypothetical protein